MKTRPVLVVSLAHVQNWDLICAIVSGFPNHEIVRADPLPMAKRT